MVSQGFFHRVQVLPLEIFNQRQLHSLPVIRLHHQGRNFGESSQPGRSPAPLSGNDLIVLGLGKLPHRQGLQNAMHRNGVGQGLELFLIKIPAGLIRIGLHPLQRRHAEISLLLRTLIVVAKQGAQASAQPFLLGHGVHPFSTISSAKSP